MSFDKAIFRKDAKIMAYIFSISDDLVRTYLSL